MTNYAEISSKFDCYWHLTISVLVNNQLAILNMLKTIKIYPQLAVTCMFPIKNESIDQCGKQMRGTSEVNLGQISYSIYTSTVNIFGFIKINQK